MCHRHQDGLAVLTCTLAFALTLGGCGSELAQNWTPTPAPDLAQPAYRRIVATTLRTIIPAQALGGDLEISGVRLVDHLKGPAWLTCVKLDAHGKPQEYALFIQGDKIIDSRSGIILDQCYKQTYTPLQLAAPETAAVEKKPTN